MNTERYNPHLCSHLRNFKPPALDFENKENFIQSHFRRDGYIFNNPNAQWGSKDYRTRFAELSDKTRNKYLPDM